MSDASGDVRVDRAWVRGAWSCPGLDLVWPGLAVVWPPVDFFCPKLRE
jgi:hypothetical protein